MESSLYLLEALKYIPHILTLVDTNTLSPTYGCFDRGFWHYRTADFPSGMYQENVLPLALVYSMEHPQNPYYGNSSIKEIVLGGMDFASRFAHRDGSCDDYYPNERALGATVFSLLAMTEAYQVLKLTDEKPVSFFIKRANWLLRHQESGRLSNHQALVVLALYNVFLITGESKFLEGAKRRLGILSSWQHPEGWFQEYEGADPGYQTVTIDAVARYWYKSGDDQVLPLLEKALKFCVYFLHPDGSFGGEYGSRNTYIAYPAGMEILSGLFPEASYLARGFLRGISRGTRVYLDDDRMVGHLVSNYLLAYKYYREKKERPYEPGDQDTRYFKGCKIAVVKRKPFYAVVALNKGGTHKVFKDEKLVSNCTGIAIKLSDGRIGVTNHISENRIEVNEKSMKVEGRFLLFKKEYATPIKLVIFRLVTVLLGKTFRGSQFIRRLLQKRLITHREFLPVYFTREIMLDHNRIAVTDEIRKEKNVSVSRLFRTKSLTSIYVAQSNAHQIGRLSSWEELVEEKEELNRQNHVTVRRVID